mmetsp:Transcript_475/g.3502  ORF Transcript_475/g.3502 Transcript_475/m.3502 type:complete len:227 (+) Transcript_475:480-1160(+)
MRCESCSAYTFVYVTSAVRGRWRLLRRAQRNAHKGTGGRWILRCGSASDTHAHRDHHPSHTHPKCARRKRAPHTRTHLCRTKEIRLCRRDCGALRRKGAQQGTLRYCTGRILEIQAPRRIGRSSRVLRCAAVCDGKWRERLRSHCQRKVTCSSCQVHEIQGWLHDLVWGPQERVHRQRSTSRPSAPRCVRHQSENHASVGSHRQARTQETYARSHHHSQPKGGGGP